MFERLKLASKKEKEKFSFLKLTSLFYIVEHTLQPELPIIEINS